MLKFQNILPRPIYVGGLYWVLFPTHITLFRFSLIVPLVNETYEAASKNQFFRDIASKEHTLPNGRKIKISSGTIKKWFLNYKHGGFDALIPKARADVGQPRNIDAKTGTIILR